MKNTVHLYLLLLTVVIIAMTWITGQFDNIPIQIIIVLLAVLSGIAMIGVRVMSRRNGLSSLS